MEDPKEVAEEQAEDVKLWFLDANDREQYLQKELRRLHRAVEGEEEEI